MSSTPPPSPSLPSIACPPQVMISLFGTLDNAAGLEMRHYLLPDGVPSPLERKISAVGIGMAIGIVGAALALLLAGGFALSVWHRRRKARELAAVLSMRRAAMNADPQVLVRPPAAASRYHASNSFKQPASMQLQQPSGAPPRLVALPPSLGRNVVK